MGRWTRILRTLAGAGILVVILALAATSAWAEQTIQELEFKASDGVSLYGTVSAEAPLRPRPLIVEYSPYGQGPGGPPAGPDFNYVQVHARGTGRSGGAWDIMGAREQLDIAESLRWLCDRPWSSGRIGLYGFSASAIAAYYAMRHADMPCVKAAALLAGTSSTYRDLIFIGGMPNFAPAAVVTTAIASAFLANLPGRFGDQPQTFLESPGGVVNAIDAFAAHPTQDAFWREREFPGPNGVPDIPPLLAATGFYDVESRGPFETFKATRSRGSHLLVIGAHDGAAGDTKGVFPQFQRWFERYLLGADNGIDREPVVQLYVGNGGHTRLRAGEWTKVDATDWPVPGTDWLALHLDARPSGSATSINDGSLVLEASAAETTQSAPTVPSNTFATDPYTTATVTSTQQTNLTETSSLTYTTPALSAPVMAVGPAALKVRLASTSPETDIVAVLSDVAPDGASNPVAAGRLRSTFTKIDGSRSVSDGRGEIVQPYNDLSEKQTVPPGEARDYYVEFWPIGNRFERGHRLRLTLAGTPASFLPSVPAANSIVVGGSDGARLHFPVLPGSDLCSALGAPPCPVRASDTARPCLALRSPIGPRNIGRVRVGLTRRTLSTLPVRLVRDTRSTRVYCVKGSHRRVTAVFAHAGARARVKLVTSTAPSHRMRRVGPGVAARQLRTRFPGGRSLSRSLFLAGSRGGRLFGMSGGRVRFVAVADRRLLHDGAKLRQLLRRAGL